MSLELYTGCFLQLILAKNIWSQLHYPTDPSDPFPTNDACLHHVILPGKTPINESASRLIWNTPRVFLVSTNATNEAENSVELGHVRRSKWSGGACFRILVFARDRISDILGHPEVAVWANSENVLVLIFASRSWNWEVLVRKKEFGEFDKVRLIRFQLVFILPLKNSNTYKIGIFCYMCRQERSITWSLQGHRGFNAKTKFHSLEGFKRKLYLQYDRQNLIESRNCELEMYFGAKKSCDDVTVILQILKTRLNLTVDIVDDIDDLDGLPPSCKGVINPAGLPASDNDMELLSSGEFMQFFKDQTVGKLFYCTGSEIFEVGSIDIFVRVVTPEVWAGVGLVTICYGLLRKNVYHGIQTLTFLMGQAIRIPSSHPNKKLLIGLLLPLVILSAWYVSYLTMDVVVPLKPKVVTSNQELLELGFRFVIPSTSVLPLIRQLAGKSLDKLGIPWSLTYFLVRPDITRAGKTRLPEFFLKLGSVNGIYHTTEDFVRMMQRMQLLNPRSNRYGNVSCSVVRQDWDNDLKELWFVGGHLAGGFMQISVWLRESGMTAFWRMKDTLSTLSNMQMSR
ncbi:hypothetical protein Fcan01_00839 [Folsomia candida]|uniref:Uncharacterized protein n=2 Tax=Folsomia candida TaxID=158441 RepID=A0A226EZ13_FOLCA|nr:hypothetical protein Fcan01_00839 [Folsomia candida]